MTTIWREVLFPVRKPMGQQCSVDVVGVRVRGVVFSRSAPAIHLGGGRNEFSQDSAPSPLSAPPPHPPLPAVNAGSPTAAAAAERMTRRRRRRRTYANGLPLSSPIQLNCFCFYYRRMRVVQMSMGWSKVFNYDILAKSNVTQ